LDGLPRIAILSHWQTATLARTSFAQDTIIPHSGQVVLRESSARRPSSTVPTEHEGMNVRSASKSIVSQIAQRDASQLTLCDVSRSFPSDPSSASLFGFSLRERVCPSCVVDMVISIGSSRDDSQPTTPLLSYNCNKISYPGLRVPGDLYVLGVAA
jgi:hypothetical protein